MGLFEKLGLIESVEEVIEMEPEVPVFVELMEKYEGEAAEKLPNVNIDTLIEDVYRQHDLDDMSKSIFKVEELIESLPKEMVTETKRATILAILDSFNLEVNDLLADASDRRTRINAMLAVISEDISNSIAEEEAQIESHKKAIADLETAIAKERKELKSSKEKVLAEYDRIKALEKFIKGEETNGF